MSIIGTGNLGAINLAGSVAGAQQNSNAEANRLKEAAVQRNTKAALEDIAARSLEDVGETDESADRDADGRMPFGNSDSESLEHADRLGEPQMPRRIQDANGERGQRLDLDA